MRSLFLLSICATCFAAHPAPTFFEKPIAFEPNAGQAPRGVRYLSRTQGMDVLLRGAEVTFARRGQEPVTVKFAGGKPPSAVTPLDKLPGVSHYYVGSDPAKWREFVPNYARVRMKEIYPGIDVVFYGKGKRLEYDFIVSPGADPSVIALACEGADSVTLDAAGDLVLAAGTWTLRQHKPRVYQTVAGRNVEVEASYEIRNESRVTIALAPYDPSLPLVIDPVIDWLTLLGGSDFEIPSAMAVDAVGNVIVAGATGSADFPITPDALDKTSLGAFVTKFNSTGSAVLYSTFLAGASVADLGFDGAGNSYIVGSTFGTSLVTTAGAFQRTPAGLSDAFAMKLTAAGTLAYSTLLGGAAGDFAQSVAVDAAGNAVVSGGTASGDFPTRNPAQPTHAGFNDAFVAKLNSTGSSLLLSTFLGGSRSEVSRAVGIDAAGNIYISGETSSLDLPARNALQAQFGGAGTDGFAAKLTSDGSVWAYATYLGGAGDDGIADLGVTPGGEAIITGSTNRIFARVPGSFGENLSTLSGRDIFVLKLNAAGSAYVYAANLGGSGDETASALALAASGEVTIAGSSTSTDYPTKAAFQSQPRSGGDPILTRLNATGTDLVYSTFFGGSQSELVTDVAVDAAGSAYIAGNTSSTDLPVTPGAYDTTPSPSGDVFVAKIAPGPAPIAVTIASAPVPGAPVLVDGRWFTTPFTLYWLPDTNHDIGVDPVARIGSTVYSFNSWSPGSNNRLQTVRTPPGSSTFTVNYNTHPTCTYALEPYSPYIPMAGVPLQMQLNVVTQPGCPWMMRPASPSISITNAEVIIGSGPAVFTIDPRQFGGFLIGFLDVAFIRVMVTPVGAIKINSPSPGQTIPVGGVAFGWDSVGSSGYDMRIARGSGIVFQGRLDGSQSNSTIVALDDGDYVFSVRSCHLGPFQPDCAAAYSSVPFRVAKTKPAQAPTITSPVSNTTLTTSTNTLRWTAVPGAQFYEVQLDNSATGAPELRIAQPATDTTFSMHSGFYRMRVRACQAACGPWSIEGNFAVSLAAVPTAAPANVACQTVASNQLSCSWNAVPNADLYVLQVVQSSTGPGGGALTVASYRGEATSVTNLPVPTHPANQSMFVIVAACNGNGCGPNSVDSAANGTRQVVPGPNPAAPFLSTPIPGSIVSGPVVQFAWNRIGTDTGNNTYRLFALDFSRQATALDILTKQNFYGAHFRAEGARYDALVFAAPPNGNPGNAAPFNVSGTNPTAPTMAVPRHQDTGVTDTIPAGNVLLGWTPVPGAALYEYYVGVPGSGLPTARGVTPGLVVQVPLAPNLYDGIVRACPAGATCTFNSDAGWGPWSNLAGPGVTKFRVQ